MMLEQQCRADNNNDNDNDHGNGNGNDNDNDNKPTCIGISPRKTI